MSVENTKADAQLADYVIRNGLIFDGTGAPGVKGDLAIRDGKVVASGPELAVKAAREIDAAGCWVTPGFLDAHTHYDAEVEVMPGIEESVRHGVTTVVMGNCSLSTALGTEQELLDLFCRVESLPREVLGSWLGGKVTWNSPRSYYEHLGGLPLGPNVASFLGHSNVRLAAMGLERSLTTPKATPEELAKMDGLVREALEAGFVGLSIDMLPWHRMDGESYRGISVPSQQADPSEYRRLANIVREYDRVLQATPNALMKKTVMRLVGMTSGIGRKGLKTTIVAAMDVKTDRKVYRMATLLARVANDVLRGNLRWQTLSEPFLNYCDGVFTPLFEEFPTGVEAISADASTRKFLFSDPVFRDRFRKDWEGRGQRLFHRDLADMWVVSSPEEGHAGKSFAQIASEAGVEPIVHFMDLMAQYDTAVRWKTEVTNDRPGPRRTLFADKYTLPGFNDSGAHNRNMAFQDGGLRMLQQIADHPETMPLEEAISKLTRRSAEWLGLDTGSIRVGDVADVVVIDPEMLKTGLGPALEDYDDRMLGAMRMVKRSDGVVRNVLIGGRMAFENGTFAEDFGHARYGRLLRAGGVQGKTVEPEPVKV